MAHISEAINKTVGNLPATIQSSEKPLTTKPASASCQTEHDSQLSTTPPDCPECHGLGFFRQDLQPGEPGFGKLVRCNHPSHSPDRQARLAAVSGLARADLSRRLKDINQVHFNAPQLVDGEMVDNWVSNRAMLIAARQIIDAPCGMLYIWGEPGNAKSEALIAIVNELNAKGSGPAVYTKLSKVVDYMRDSYAEIKHRDSKGPEAQDLGYIARFDRLKAVKVLAIDEMDKIKNLTGFVEDFRFDFLDERYRQARRGETITVFASNGDPANLPMPIYDRIREFTIVENTAPSARPHMRKG